MFFFVCAGLTLLDYRNCRVAISTCGMRVEIHRGVLDALLQRPWTGEPAYPYPDHAAGVQQPDSFRYQRVLSKSENLIAYEQAVLGSALKQMLV